MRKYFIAVLFFGCATSKFQAHQDTPASLPTSAQNAPSTSRFAEPPAVADGRPALRDEADALAKKDLALGDDFAPSMGEAESGPAPSGKRSAPTAEKSRRADAAPPAANLGGGASGALAQPSMPSPKVLEPRPTPEQRPGLATSWGENRFSQVSEVPFERQSNYPSCQGSIYYNDATGVGSAARREPWNNANLHIGCGVSLQVRGEYGNVLPAARSGNRLYAVGTAGQRYTISILNNSNQRFEAVVSVDGLDVLDGKGAGMGKRGYLVPAHGEVTIDGFRRSNDEVAAFRFGAVSDSYAALTGNARNVGLIGIAAFAERSVYVPPPYSYYDNNYYNNNNWQELRRRENANPFPGGYARPPETFTAR